MTRLFPLPVLILAAGLAACAAEPRPLDRPDLLTPLTHDYKSQIVTWAKNYFVEPASLRQARISTPIRIEDRTRIPMWLVCAEVNARGGDGTPLGPQRFAFGFANGAMLSAPERRGPTSLVSADCDRLPLTWKPFPELERIKAPARLR